MSFRRIKACYRLQIDKQNSNNVMYIKAKSLTQRQNKRLTNEGNSSKSTPLLKTWIHAMKKDILFGKTENMAISKNITHIAANIYIGRKVCVSFSGDTIEDERANLI